MARTHQLRSLGATAAQAMICLPAGVKAVVTRLVGVWRAAHVDGVIVHETLPISNEL